jgi:hypothetical protein
MKLVLMLPNRKEIEIAKDLLRQEGARSNVRQYR